MARSFDELVREAETASIDGWDFSWLDGRAVEDRPPWRYFDRVAERTGAVGSLLDVETGAAMMIRDLPVVPSVLAATEGHKPNLTVAAERLSNRDGFLVAADPGAGLPFASDSFELVTSRHPIRPNWEEIARVLEPGGTYLSQQVGPYSLRSLTETVTGAVLAPGSTRDPDLAVASATEAGLSVVDLRIDQPRTVFYDIGAVVYFLRLVVWVVPGFDVDKYRDNLRALHERIESDGSFETTASRFLIAATKTQPR